MTQRPEATVLERLQRQSARAYEHRYRDPEAAFASAREAVALAETLTERSAEANRAYAQALLVWGLYYARKHERQEAYRVLWIALTLDAFAPGTLPHGELLIQYADAAITLAKSKEVLEPLYDTYRAFTANTPQLPPSEQTLWRGKAALYIGAAQQRISDFTEALHWFTVAFEHYDAVGFDTVTHYFNDHGYDVVGLLVDIANLRHRLGEYDRAINYGQQALHEARRYGYAVGEAFALSNLGTYADAAGDYDQALACLTEALACHEALGKDLEKVATLQSMASVHLKEQRYRDAETALVRAFAIVQRRDGNPFNTLGEVLQTFGALRFEQQRYREALLYLREALEVLTVWGEEPHLGISIHRQLAEAYRANGDFERGLEHLGTAYRLDIEHRERTYNARMQELVVKFDVERALKDKEIYRLKNVELEALHRQLSEQAKALTRLSERDGLTGLCNRRVLDERLARIFADSVRDDTPLCVMICDIDNFKSVNDTFSHATGDAVLRTVAGIIEQTRPQRSLSARYGGEEFVIVFPGLSLDESHAACETLRARVAAHDWASVHAELVVTLSLGVAARGAHTDHEKLLSDADGALYRAKRSGKNRVCTAETC